MKKHFLIFLFAATTLTGIAQEEVLFIGLYSNASNGKSYWCRDMEMVKQEVKTAAEAQQLEIDFRKEHSKESPIVKIASKGSLVIYDFQKEDKAFNCTYRVIGWKEGKTRDDARQALANDEERIKKEYNGQPNELFAWQAGPQTGIKAHETYFIAGISITFKQVKKEGVTTNWLAEITNPLKEDAAFIAFLVDGVRNPKDAKNDFKLEPGETLKVTLGKIKEAEALVSITSKSETDVGVINAVKNYTRQKFIEYQGHIATPSDGASMGGRN